jgi:hypothetical protein
MANPLEKNSGRLEYPHNVGENLEFYEHCISIRKTELLLVEIELCGSSHTSRLCRKQEGGEHARN